MKTNFVIITILTVFSKSLFAEITPDLPNIAPTEKTNLYVEKVEQIKELQTVTYFFTEKEIPPEVKQTFKYFANNLGLTHGAIIINKKEEDYLKYSKVMKCDINVTSYDLIIFENRKIKNKDKQCVYFYIYDLENINKLLAIINKYLGDIEEMKKTGFKYKISGVVNDFCSENEWCKNNKKSVNNLTDNILEII